MTRIGPAVVFALLLLRASAPYAYVSFGETRHMHPDGGANTRQDVGVHLETDGAGHWVAATDGPYVSTSSDNGDTWTIPVLVPPGYGFLGFWGTEPMVTTDRNGTWLLAWTSWIGVGSNEVMLSRSTDNGATWSTGVAIASNALADDEYNNRPRLATDGAGKWMAVWHTADPVNGDDDVMFTTSIDNGLTWAPVDWVNPLAPFDTVDENWPSVASDGAGNWVVAYNVFGSSAPSWRIDAYHSSDFGASWSGPARLGTTLGLGVVDVDSGGPGSFVTVHAGVDTLVSTTTDGGVSWGGSTTVSRFYGATQARARLATDGHGEWVAIWDSRDDPYGIGGGDQDVVFARSVDNGEKWLRTDYVDFKDAATDGETDGWSDIATDGAGRWIAAWQRQSGSSRDIFIAISDPLCPSTPRDDCITGATGKASFSISDKDGLDKDTLKFKLSKGGATNLTDFGDVTSTDDLLLCVWDASEGVDQLVWRASLHAGGTCGGVSCWKQTATSFSYADKLLEKSAFIKAQLKAGEAGKAGVYLLGKGVGLEAPRTPFKNEPAIAVQLISTQTTKCWGATFSTPKKNDYGKYAAKSD